MNILNKLYNSTMQDFYFHCSTLPDPNVLLILLYPVHHLFYCCIIRLFFYCAIIIIILKFTSCDINYVNCWPVLLCFVKGWSSARGWTNIGVLAHCAHKCLVNQIP